MIFKPEDYAPEELFQLNKRKYSIFYRQTSEDYTDFVIQQGSTPSGNDYEFVMSSNNESRNDHGKFSLVPKLITQPFLSMDITY